jgi:hypothetical protein
MRKAGQGIRMTEQGMVAEHENGEKGKIRNENDRTGNGGRT